MDHCMKIVIFYSHLCISHPLKEKGRIFLYNLHFFLNTLYQHIQYYVSRGSIRKIYLNTNQIPRILKMERHFIHVYKSVKKKKTDGRFLTILFQLKRTHFQETRHSNIKHFHRIKAQMNTVLNADKEITTSLIKWVRKCK